ncbi:MAG: hypothetical protein CVV44_12805 [Spirochaetae bacterium HGW-Spirochaetae-1]|jgi:methyl-accepting chemotaxis protein|nr:MAG: hypothetical protein CVV44_12805 [Spirochaetae bacterium HGW-Spirochaetae-1]
MENKNKDKIEEIGNVVQAIIQTALDVNRHSHTRKEITADSLELVRSLIDRNKLLKEKYEKVYTNFRVSLESIVDNSEQLDRNVQYFSEIIETINNIKATLNTLEGEINKLTSIAIDIRNDTDEIFTLALNASIVSSKYAHTSGVFDILANKLNEMSNFINQNLASIMAVVTPITEGIVKLISNNEKVLDDIESGYLSFIGFNDILGKQKDSIDQLVSRAADSGGQIDEQKVMLSELDGKISQMDEDAVGAINGSANVAKTGEGLNSSVKNTLELIGKEKQYGGAISSIMDQAAMVWQTAQDVNARSRSQLDFSLSSVEFCDSLIDESSTLREMTEILSNQAAESNNIAGYLSNNLGELSMQLNEIEKNLGDSNGTIHKFNEDYGEIDNIVKFLKNILNSMNVIGMMSRIESARKPDEFSQFMTISENISELQNHIHNNIPNIEDNINSTHDLIKNVNDFFESISSKFFVIAESTKNIIDKLGEITAISSESQDFSREILENSTEQVKNVTGLRESLMGLTEVVKKPIEGSAANIDRGKTIEEICLGIFQEETVKSS